jgi:hypothetical protein
MFGSTALEVAIGMCFCYGFVGLLVSTLQEALAAALHLRARTLLHGVQAMLADPGFTGLAQAVYGHALVNPRDDGQATDAQALRHKPSYIDPQAFAIALTDALGGAGHDWAALGQAIETLPDPHLRAALRSLYVRADGNLARFQDGTARWFDHAMDRVSGAYKRRAGAVSLLLALLIAIGLNLDSVHLFQALWQHPALTARLAVPAAADGPALAALLQLPVGWERFPPALDGHLAAQVAGWAMTAVSALFGAPFWFELLQRLINMRATGDKPAARRA